MGKKVILTEKDITLCLAKMYGLKLKDATKLSNPLWTAWKEYYPEFVELVNVIKNAENVEEIQAMVKDFKI